MAACLGGPVPQDLPGPECENPCLAGNPGEAGLLDVLLLGGVFVCIVTPGASFVS